MFLIQGLLISLHPESMANTVFMPVIYFCFIFILPVAGQRLELYDIELNCLCYFSSSSIYFGNLMCPDALKKTISFYIYSVLGVLGITFIVVRTVLTEILLRLRYDILQLVTWKIHF